MPVPVLLDVCNESCSNKIGLPIDKVAYEAFINIPPHVTFPRLSRR